MARPYAITLLLGWIAHAAFCHFSETTQGKRSAGITYGMAATASAWLHPIAAPFVVAPLIWYAARLWYVEPALRRQHVIRLLQVALPTGAAMALLLLPPLLANPGAMALKSGVDAPDAATLMGVWYAWLGTPSSIVVVLCLGVATLGAREVWQRMPEARTGILGILLTLAAVMLTRPTWSFMPLSVARYLLPFLPLLLLALAAGAVRLSERIVPARTLPGRAGAAMIALLPWLALGVQSPLHDMLQRPGGHALHLVHHMDFRPEVNPYGPNLAGIPLSPFWQSLALQPPGSLRIAAAPFYFESFDWDAPRWERISGQRILPGFVTGFCVDRRWGEVPADARFRFRNSVHVAAAIDNATRDIDYLVWQKPYMRPRDGANVPIGGETAHCERLLMAHFGEPAYEDEFLMAFRLSSPGTRADAAR